MKKLLIGVLLVIQFNLAYAADFPTLPYTFVAKQLISAAKVMANYNALRNGIIDGTKKINVAELWINGIKRINSSGVLVEDNIYKIPGEYATLALAVEAIGSATANIEIDTVTVETVGTEIPTNVIELKFGALGQIGSAVTVTFNGQHINAPNNVQIFGDSLTVTGNISNRGFPINWFKDSSNTYWQTAFNKAFDAFDAEKEVYLLNSNYDISAPIFMNPKNKLIGLNADDSRIRVTSALDDRYAIFYNWSQEIGGSVINTTLSKEGLLKGFALTPVADSPSTTNCLGVYAAGGLSAENLKINRIKKVYTSPDIQRDLMYLKHIEAEKIYSYDNYAIDIYGKGDAVLIDQMHFVGLTYPNAKALRIDITKGSSIDNSIFNGEVYLNRSHGLNMSNIHMEHQSGSSTTPLLIINGGNVAIRDSYIYKNNVQSPIRIIASANFNEYAANVKLENVTFVLPSFVDFTQEVPEIDLADRCTLKLTNVNRYSWVSGDDGFLMYTGIKVSGNAEFNNFSYAYSKDSTLNGYGYPENSIDISRTNIGDSWSPLAAIGTNGNYTWNKTGDTAVTYYYTVISLFDTNRLLMNATTTQELSKEITTGFPAIELDVRYGSQDVYKIQRIYRGLASKQYNSQIDLHNISFSKIVDDGINVFSTIWEARATTDIDGYNTITRFKTNGKQVEVWMEDLPEVGIWTQDDIVRYSGTVRQGGMKCTTAGGAYKEIWTSGNSYVTGNWVLDPTDRGVYKALQNEAGIVTPSADSANTYWDLVTATPAEWGEFDGYQNAFVNSNQTYTVKLDDRILFVATDSGDTTLVLPPIANVAKGKEYIISHVSGINSVILSSSDAVSSNKGLTVADNAKWHLISDGNKWWDINE